MADKEKYIPETDIGRIRVDEDLKDLEERISRAYRDAAKDITTDLDAFMQRFETLDEKKREDVEKGMLSEKDYKDWKERQVFRSDVMQAKIDDLSDRMVHADQQAMAMVNKELPDVYATSYNYEGYRSETMAGLAGFDYTQFTIINEDAVRVLMTEDPDLIPWKPSVDVDLDKRWNRKHIQNAVQQGIIKGDSMDTIAKRLLPVVNMDKNAAIRTARTAVNGIENKGRRDATQRVIDAGIPMVEVWSATHDGRTRRSHILMDGETRGEDGLFSNGLEYPAEPNGNVDGSEIYNCRCRLNSYLEGIDHSKDDELYAKMMEEEYYEDWEKVKVDREEKEADFQKNKEKAEEWARNKERRKGLDENGDKAKFIPSKGQIDYEEKIRDGKTEKGAYFDEQGNMVLQSIGGSNEVEFDPHDMNRNVERKVWDGEKIDFTHNHPADTIFSPDDIQNLEDLENRSVSAVLPNGTTYRLERNQPMSSTTWIYDEEIGDYRREFEPLKIAKDYNDEYMRIVNEEIPRSKDYSSYNDYLKAKDDFYTYNLTPRMEKWLEENAEKRGYIFHVEKKKRR